MTDGPAMTALIVEDDRNIRRSVCMSLETSGWTVHEAETLRQALAHARSHNYDLAIVDLGLADGDGVDLIAAIRQDSQVPIIVLSARSEEQHKVRALDAGADDYVEKPFGVGELLARLRAALRQRSHASEPPPPIVKSDRAARRPQARQGRSPDQDPVRVVRFPRQERRPRADASQLLRDVWGPGRVEHAPYLRVFMASLRQKLEEDPAQPKLIITETGVGYRLMAGEASGSEFR
jgi:two-component system KDP operon response regulator KdpE